MRLPRASSITNIFLRPIRTKMLALAELAQSWASPARYFSVLR
jgi:hypothetical protein